MKATINGVEIEIVEMTHISPDGTETPAVLCPLHGFAEGVEAGGETVCWLCREYDISRN